MKKYHIFLFLSISISLIIIFNCKSNSPTEQNNEDPSPNTSDVSGTWTTDNSPYQVNEKLIIPDGETLIINPGVEIIFNGHYQFEVNGRLLAVGTEQDSIKFIASNKNAGWHGIRLLNVSSTNDSTIFEYCIFKNGKANTGSGADRSGGAIIANTGKLRISHCLFQNNIQSAPSRPDGGGGAIAITGGQPIIEYCEFNANESTYGAAILNVNNSTNPIIRNNYFHNNYGHGIINSVENASPILINNLIESNLADEHGIVHIGSGSGSVILINNTIVNNTCEGGSAIFVNDSSPPLCINNIIYGNESSQIDYSVSSAYYFFNCLIEEFNAVYPGNYENCIDSNPLFVGSDNFNLQEHSPCIGAGVESVEINSVIYSAPSVDIEGDQRPNPVNTTPDIGAYEYGVN